MEIAVRHYMRGRIRLAAHKLCADRALSEQALAFLRVYPGVRGARVNYECVSIVVDFDPAIEPTLRLLIGRRRNSRRRRADRPKDDHRRRLAGQSRRRRSGLRRDSPARGTAHHPRQPRRLGHHRRADRPPDRLGAGGRHAHAEPRRNARRPAGHADPWAGGRLGRAHRRFQSLPQSGHRRLRRRHTRRRADRRSVLDDPSRALWHCHQERPAYGKAGGGRHDRLRQDRRAE